MAITPTDAILRVQDNTGRPSTDQQCPAAVIARRLDVEYKLLRRRLAAEFPELYEKTALVTVAAGATTISEPTDYESMRLLERLTGNGQWLPVGTSSSLNRRESLNVTFYEQGSTIVLAPDDQAPGSYRLTYLTKPASNYTYYDVPDGMEQIIIEEVSAFVRQRHEEDPTYHKREAQRIWDDQYMSLWNRFGSHGRSGLNITRE